MIAEVLGGVAVAAIAAAQVAYSKRVDDRAKQRTELLAARLQDAEVDAMEVSTLRQVIAEVRASEAQTRTDLAAVRAELVQVRAEVVACHRERDADRARHREEIDELRRRLEGR